MEYNEEEFREVINTLKSLDQVKAPAYFEADLMRKIHSETYREETPGFWKRFFIPSRFVPSAALAVTTIIILFVLNINVDPTENPLLSDPKVREDIISTNTIQDSEMNTEVNQPTATELEERSNKDLTEKTETGSSYTSSPNYPAQTVSTFIDKNGLNFRQVTIPKEQMEQIKRMRERLMLMLESTRQEQN